MASPSAAPSRRTSRQVRAAQPVPRGGPAHARARTVGGRPPGKSPVELRPLRLAALALLLVAAALYVSPLRAFFAQQDRYDREVASLAQAQVANQTLHTQIDLMRTRDFITRRAREQYQLVPPGLQAFVVKGLPKAERNAAAAGPATPAPSLLDRLADLWRTIRE
jgi:cell division protein FtsB